MSLPKVPSDWFNKEPNGQYLGKRGQTGFPGKGKNLGLESMCVACQGGTEEIGHTVQSRDDWAMWQNIDQ